MLIEFLLSKHAKHRMKERLNVKNSRRAQREMELAYTKGQLINSMKTNNTSYILFNNAIYIFYETISSLYKVVLLITVYKDINKVYQAYKK